jgi:hypothetical protein
MVEQQITIENVRFEQVVVRLKTAHDNRLEHLSFDLRISSSSSRNGTTTCVQH